MQIVASSAEPAVHARDATALEYRVEFHASVVFFMSLFCTLVTTPIFFSTAWDHPDARIRCGAAYASMLTMVCSVCAFNITRNARVQEWKHHVLRSAWMSWGFTVVTSVLAVVWVSIDVVDPAFQPLGRMTLALVVVTFVSVVVTALMHRRT